MDHDWDTEPIFLILGLFAGRAEGVYSMMYSDPSFLFRRLANHAGISITICKTEKMDVLFISYLCTRLGVHVLPIYLYGIGFWDEFEPF
ncbi:hypothetical protein [Bacillus sp. S3]|uniref:hypothetical protein n=1 Tax=Bacillus sp. S3 TaxID=486398 RepID=UPI0021DFB4B0|nr:hypothetical protein [Bacillus sp. S3]